jgi:hypothetical protein
MMKLTAFPLLFFFFFSCDTHKRSKEQFPLQPEPLDRGWIVYEGRIPLDDKRNLYLEVFMQPGNEAGEGTYRLTEAIEEENSGNTLPTLQGKYSTFYGTGQEDLVVHFHNSARIEDIKRTYYDPLSKTIKERSLRIADLTFQRRGEHTLVMLYQDSEPVSLESQHNLVKRTSRLFTVEGYFEHAGDSSAFFEMNTQEKWPVSKLGAYDLAISQYHLLAQEKSEGIYLKGIAFSVIRFGREGKPVDALVFKKIIQMTSSPRAEARGN